MIEVYNFSSGAPGLLFHEFCHYIGQKGFRCIDLFDPLYRQSDQSFWQMDLVFVRSNRPEFSSHSYSQARSAL
jgi:hypothetical protein